MINAEWFERFGVYAIVDGQFGSTGKGLLAAYLTEQAEEYGATIDRFTTNAGPNSGHTFIDREGNPVVSKLTPSGAAWRSVHRKSSAVYLNSGSVIDPEILAEEAKRFPYITYSVHPHAAVILPEDMGQNQNIGSTGKGVGPALARRIGRDPKAVFGGHDFGMPDNVHVSTAAPSVRHSRVLMEVPQGFSLGIGAGFYPYCTARQCTVTQGLADAGVGHGYLRRTAMALRTYPIRVGGPSGPGYPMQREMSWEEIGQPPEYTTVTKKQRRVFDLSHGQIFEAAQANTPDTLFINFVNYVEEDRDNFISGMIRAAEQGAHKPINHVLCGFGPANGDIQKWR